MSFFSNKQKNNNLVSSTSKPLMENVCLFYGAPAKINYLTDIEKIIEMYSSFDFIIWGDNVQLPTHNDYSNSLAVITRLKQVKPNIKIAGYIHIGADKKETTYSMEEFKSLVDAWKVFGATHIFLDEFGYDYMVTRDRQNECVQYCHDNNLFVIANAWDYEHIFSPNNITISWRGNFQGNPNSLSCILGENDYVLFENTHYYFDSNNLNNKQHVKTAERILDMLDYTQTPRLEFDNKSYYEHFKTKGLVLDAILNKDDKMFTEGYLSALSCKMEAYCASVNNWGSGSTNYQYHQYIPPKVNATSRKEIGKTTIDSFQGRPNTRFTTKVGQDVIDIIWTTKADGEFIAPIFEEPKSQVVSLTIPDEHVVMVDNTYFEVLLGSDDAYNSFSTYLAKDSTGADIRRILSDSNSYRDTFKENWTASSDGNKIIYTSKRPLEVIDGNWWTYHRADNITPRIQSTFEVEQAGSLGSLDIRQVSLNGDVLNAASGETWRRPYLVKNGTPYFDTDLQKPIWFNNGEWSDFTSQSNEYPNDLANIENSISDLRTEVNVHLNEYPNDLAKKVNTTILYEGDMNTLTTEGFYYVHGTAINRPLDGASFYISVFRYNDLYIKQIAYRATGTPDVASEVYMRQLVLGVWQTWVKLINQKDLAPYQQIATATAASQNITSSANTDLIFTSVTGADWASINNGKVRLQAGKYDLLMVTAFAFGTGARAITPHLSTHTVSQNAVSLTNTMTRIQGSAKFTLTAAADLFLPAFQNSGGELPVSATVQITRIGDA